MNSSLTRPLAVVTGASNGIGYELAKQFAQDNFDLLVTATGPSINEADRAFEKLGAQVETVEADLATYEGVETLYSKIKAAGRSVDAIAIDDPAQVAKQGVEALMAGKDHIIAGSLKTKIMGAASQILPDTVSAEVHRQLTEPGSAHK
jgi:short-subunit dehydrogenase